MSNYKPAHPFDIMPDTDYSTIPEQPAYVIEDATAKLSVADQEYQRQVKKLIHQLEFRIAKAKKERTNAEIASDLKPDDTKALAKVNRVELKLSDLHGELAIAKSQLL